MTKHEFIGNFLEKSTRIKRCKLPYGMGYLNLLAKVTEDAEKAYKKYKKSKTT